MTEYELLRLSAWTLLRLRRETLARECADERERALWANAALLSESLRCGGERVFTDAEEVLRALGADEINDLVELYAEGDGAHVSEEGAVNVAFDPGRWAQRTGGGA